MDKIENIKNPDFLKELNNDELAILGADIREFILENVSNMPARVKCATLAWYTLKEIEE